MLTLRDHGVEDYQSLLDMDATDVGELRDDDRACLAALGEYLTSTDACQRFGIWLLHKHFEPAPGEVFVERTVRDPRGTATRPIDRSNLDDLLATAIRFGDNDSAVEVVGMEFAQPGDFGDTAPLSDDDELVLGGIAERLRAHDKVERFGVRLIRNPLELTDGEMLHESCDSATRTMHCSVSQRDEMLADRATIQTAWKWRVMPGGTEPIVMQECTAGCVRIAGGHDISHTAAETDDQDDPIGNPPAEPF
jgi:hypothetical protein